MILTAILAPLFAALLTMAFKPLDVRRAARIALSAGAMLLPLTLIGQVDALSLLFAGIVSLLGFAATVFSTGMYSFDWGVGEVFWSRKSVYFVLLGSFWSAMLLVVLAPNLGLLWLGVSMTTLATAFLVGFGGEREALEAAWKYLVLCSIGMAIALLGILVLAHVSLAAGVDPRNALSWAPIGRQLQTPLGKVACVLLLIGFATKAGLVPMHAWLPDAHSRAPAPVSALLSGVLVSCSIYAIVRVIFLASALGAETQVRLVMLCLGSASTVVAGTLMLVQTDLKRLLAYSTVEHAGIVVLALAFGGPLGTFAALLHVVSHSLAKSAAFFSAGLVQKAAGTTHLGRLRGLWCAGASGKLLLAALTALCGMPPFGLFVSELLFVAAGVVAREWGGLACGILGLVLAFVAIARATLEIEGGHAKCEPALARVPRLSIASTTAVIAIAAAAAIVPWTSLGPTLHAVALEIGKL